MTDRTGKFQKMSLWPFRTVWFSQLWHLL